MLLWQPPNLVPCLLWPNGSMHQDATCYGGRPRPRLRCVRLVLAFPQRGRAPPPLLAHVYCGQTARWIKIPLGTEVDLGPGDIVLDGDPALLRKRHIAPLFSAHTYCDQTAGRIKIPLGTEVDRGPGDIVLDGGPSPLQKGEGWDSSRPLFGPCIVAKLLHGSRCHLVRR